MYFQRILLKNDDGRPLSCLTVCGTPPKVTLPKGAEAHAFYAGGIVLLHGEGSFLLPSNAKDLSVLGSIEGVPFFATTLPEKQGAYVKWLLLSALEKEAANKEDLPTNPLPPKEVPAEDEGGKPKTEEEKKEPLPEEETPEESAESALDRAEKLLQRGTPFPLFSDLMPSSRWALIDDENASYLVGIKEDEEGKHVFLGVPGARDFPPDKEMLWSFFPTEESGDVGYFLTEAEELNE